MSLPHHYIVRQPSVSPVAGEEPDLLILLHGYGSNEEDLMGLASYLDPRFHIVSIRAPVALDQGDRARGAPRTRGISLRCCGLAFPGIHDGIDPLPGGLHFVSAHEKGCVSI